MKKTAMIYVKDNDRKAEQKFFCLAYCLDNEYEVLSTTNDIDEVDNCDIMVVASPEMISRDRIEYYIVLDDLTAKGIKVEIVSVDGDAGKYIDYVTQLYVKGRI
ncbi:MAG: hypothetical protein IKL08_07475 [Clostridia bacterium]|nr:hypothetical protein [Clostridia bacterium]